MSEFKEVTFNRNLSGLDVSPDLREVLRQYQEALVRIQRYLRETVAEVGLGEAQVERELFDG